MLCFMCLISSASCRSQRSRKHVHVNSLQELGLPALERSVLVCGWRDILAFAALSAKRVECGLVGSASLAFNVAILVGACQMAAQGLASTACRAEAHASGPVWFCLLYCSSRLARFDTTVYGEECASRQCRSWADRMNCYCELSK